MSTHSRHRLATPTTILVAVSDPVLHAEASHAAAATGAHVLDATDPAEIRRWVPKATAVLADAECAAMAATARHLFFIVPDPGPIDWQAAMNCHAEAAFVLPSQATDLLSALGTALRQNTARATTGGSVITVMGSAGGAGTSTLAAALARQLDGPTALIDAALLSGGLDLLLGAEEARGPRWADLDFHTGCIDGEELLLALPAAGTVRILTTARTTIDERFVVGERELIGAIESLRGAAQSIIIDAGVGLPAAIEAAKVSDLVVLVVPAEVRAAAAAAGLAGRLRAQSVHAIVVLRHRGWSGLGAEDVEKLTECEVIAEWGTIPALAKSAELSGLPESLPKGLTRVVSALAGEMKGQAA